VKRKSFLHTLSTLAVGFPVLSNVELSEPSDAVLIKPPYLKAGSLIGITSPAGYITQEELQPALQQLQQWGFRVRLGSTIGKRDHTFGGTDEERRSDFQQMLDDPQLEAILCARGGYGVVRIVDGLNWKRFREKPKWVIGFSDITVLHSHIHRHTRVASLHSKMCNSFPDQWDQAESIVKETILSIKDALTGTTMRYSAPPNSLNRWGNAEGELVGGNLKILETLAGTPSDLNMQGKILFLEDVGEYLYNVDRMFWNLKRTGKLDHINGLIIGGFNRLKTDDPGEEFGMTVPEIVMQHIRDASYPVCFDFPVGHQKNNYALKCGVQHCLQVDETGSRLDEI
jgi:muramoyltetrapeptide carboxypeptidase